MWRVTRYYSKADARYRWLAPVCSPGWQASHEQLTTDCPSPACISIVVSSWSRLVFGRGHHSLGLPRSSVLFNSLMPINASRRKAMCGFPNVVFFYTTDFLPVFFVGVAKI